MRYRIAVLVLSLVTLSGCGKGVCGGWDTSKATSSGSPCGVSVFYIEGKAYTQSNVRGVKLYSRYSAEPTKPGTATTVDGCVYELSPGWYGDEDCAFPVQ